MKQLIYFFTICFLFFACHSHDEHDHTHEHDESTPHEHTHEEVKTSTKTEDEHLHDIVLTKAQFLQLNIKTGDVPQKNIESEIKAVGKLHLPPQNRALAGTILSGKISAIHVHEGEIVKKGQLLASITDPKVIEMQRAFLLAKEDLKLKKAEFERQQILKPDDATSEKNLTAARSAYNAAQAQTEALRAELRLTGINPDMLSADKIVKEIPVVAPIAGSVYAINTNLGEFVPTEKALFEIYNLEHLHIEILVNEKDILHVKTGQKISFKIAKQFSDAADKQYSAKVYAIAGGVDTENKTVKVHAEIDGMVKNLMPGMFVEVFVAVEEIKGDVLPEHAVFKDENGYFAYRMKSANAQNYIFEKVPLRVATITGGYVCLSDLKEKSNFVLEGAYYLHSTANKEEGAGHSH